MQEILTDVNGQNQLAAYHDRRGGAGVVVPARSYA